MKQYSSCGVFKAEGGRAGDWEGEVRRGEDRRQDGEVEEVKVERWGDWV